MQSLLSPRDHKDRKLLMYALRTREVNFWEEHATREGEGIGRQRHEAFAWTWRTRRTALRGVELVKSQFRGRTPLESGSIYHGLGLRLRRDFGSTGGNRFLEGAVEKPFADGPGVRVQSASFKGSIDGTLPVQGAGVRIGQEHEQDHGPFVLESPFAFLSSGPSNLGARGIAAGATVVGAYTVATYDCAAPPRKRTV